MNIHFNGILHPMTFSIFCSFPSVILVFVIGISRWEIFFCYVCLIFLRLFLDTVQLNILICKPARLLFKKYILKLSLVLEFLLKIDIRRLLDFKEEVEAKPVNWKPDIPGIRICVMSSSNLKLKRDKKVIASSSGKTFTWVLGDHWKFWISVTTKMTFLGRPVCYCEEDKSEAGMDEWVAEHSVLVSLL